MGKYNEPLSANEAQLFNLLKIQQHQIDSLTAAISCILSRFNQATLLKKDPDENRRNSKSSHKANQKGERARIAGDVPRWCCGTAPAKHPRALIREEKNLFPFMP